MLYLSSFIYIKFLAWCIPFTGISSKVNPSSYELSTFILISFELIPTLSNNVVNKLAKPAHTIYSLSKMYLKNLEVSLSSLFSLYFLYCFTKLYTAKYFSSEDKFDSFIGLIKLLSFSSSFKYSSFSYSC